MYTTEQLKNRGLSDAEIAAYQSFRDTLNFLLKDVIDKWKTLGQNYTEIDINAIVDRFIETKIGNLNNLPPEVYETVQHTLHEYFGLLKEATHPGWLPQMVKNAKT